MQHWAEMSQGVSTNKFTLPQNRLQISLLILKEFKQIINLYSSRNHQKTGFLMISEETEVNFT